MYRAHYAVIFAIAQLSCFQNGWEFLVQILHTYYTFLSSLDGKFLSNWLQLWRSYAILSSTTIMLKMSTIGWNVR